MNTHKKSRTRRPNRSCIELMTLKRIWWQMSQAERYAWFELFATDAEPSVHRCLIYHELGVSLRNDEQLCDFLEWALKLELITWFRNN